VTLVLVFGSNVDNRSANKLDETDVNGATRLIKSAFTWTLPMISDVLGRASSPEPVEPSPFKPGQSLTLARASNWARAWLEILEAQAIGPSPIFGAVFVAVLSEFNYKFGVIPVTF
jgi:hypothetical protein